jgi:uncharacterized protein (DUF433 family)
MGAKVHVTTNIAGVFFRVARRGHHENAATVPTALGTQNRAPYMSPWPRLRHSPTFAFRVTNGFANMFVRMLGHFRGPRLTCRSLRHYSRLRGYLTPNPKSAYKQLFIQGGRIRAQTLYGMDMSGEEPMMPEEIARQFQLAVEAALEAIVYCEAGPPELWDRV